MKNSPLKSSSIFIPKGFDPMAASFAKFPTVTPANIGGGNFPRLGASNPGSGLAIMMGASILSQMLAKRREVERQLRIKQNQQREARKEVERYRGVFQGVNISNPYSNLTNPFEGIKLNLTAGAEVSRDQFQRTQANALADFRRGSSSGSGIAQRVKLLSQMGMDAAQKSAASIQNIDPFMQRQEAKIDQLQRSGRNVSAMFEAKKLERAMSDQIKDQKFEYARRLGQENRDAQMARFMRNQVLGRMPTGISDEYKDLYKNQNKYFTSESERNRLLGISGSDATGGQINN